MNRHGVLTRGAVAAEAVPGGFAMLYKVLRTFEEAGRCQRGYFVESLGGAQFAVASTVDRLRSYLDGGSTRNGRNTGRSCWPPPTRPTPTARHCPGRPPRGGRRSPGPGARPGRKAGALVVLVDGELAWFLERGGRSLLTFTDDPAADHAAATGAGRPGRRPARRIDPGRARRRGTRRCSPRRAQPGGGLRCPTPASPAPRAGCDCAKPCPRVTRSGTRRPAARAPGRSHPDPLRYPGAAVCHRRPDRAGGGRGSSVGASTCSSGSGRPAFTRI